MHKRFLGMNQLEILDQTIDIIPPINLPSRIYIDDAIMLFSNAKHMKMVLAQIYLCCDE
jgi:hypothetical protein